MRHKHPAAPALVAIGGRLESDNAALFAELKRLSQGRIAVLATASSLPEQVGQDAVEVMVAHGIDADLLPVTIQNAATSTRDPKILARVRDSGGVYFTGGDQSALVAALIRDGEDTPLLSALRALAARGGLISGSSAGAAVLPSRIILGGTSMDALAHGLSPDVTVPGLPMGPGFGFFPWGMIDQHFLKRGRIGRLLMGTWAAGFGLGFGIDENTGLVVEGRLAKVVGETGVVVINLRGATIAPDGSRFDGVKVSYLDHGDSFDLIRRAAIPAPNKHRIGLRKASFTTPARSWRHIFGSYAFSELMIRLAEADHRVYAEDRAVAYETVTETEVTLSLKRVPRRSRALVARTDGQRRHTMLGFELGLARRKLALAEHDAALASVVEGVAPTRLRPQGRLICLGSTPARGSFELMGQLRRELKGPIGIIAAAAEDARRTARDFADLFREYDMETEDLGIGEHTIGSANEDEALIARIRTFGSIVFVGGNQRRLVDALLEHGRETAVLKAVGDAYRAGASLVAVSGAASALSRVMIAGGGSYAALRYGIASGGDSGGIEIDEGFGLFDLGILDQNLVHRNRLGRLIVACAEEQSRWGFGLCEETGIIVPAAGGPLQVFGRHGMAVVEIDHGRVTVQSDSFTAEGLNLWVVRPGESFEPATRKIGGDAGGAARTVGPGSLIDELARECRVSLGGPMLPLGPKDPVRLRVVSADERRAVLDIASLRTDE
jgi:cyanophycinase